MALILTKDGNRRNDDEMVELVPEVVEFHTLHKREEELYFFDTFAYPWEKDKHYRLVYQLEKRYFPDWCFDKAFLELDESNVKANKAKKRASKGGEGKVNLADGKDERRSVFFEGEEKEKDGGGRGKPKHVKIDISEKKVEEFFQRLKNVPNTDVADADPFVSSRSAGVPPKWDSPIGTVVLFNKPKGRTAFG